MAQTPLQSLVATGTKLWLDSIDPQEVAANRAFGASGATSNPIIVSDLLKTGRFDDLIAQGIRDGYDDEALAWHLTYSFVDATYRSNFQVTGDSNSTADDNGNIQVRPGNRIPLIARHTGRLRLDYSLSDKWEIGGSFIYSSGVFLHGNENNANVADGGEFIGSGKIGG